MAYARTVFRIAAVYGFLVLLPQYFMEKRIGRDDPPPITHPEHFYGFVGLALVWQVAFLVISGDPVRFRPLVIPSVLEKAAFGIPVLALYLQGRTSGTVLAFGSIDLVLGILFLIAWFRLR